MLPGVLLVSRNLERVLLSVMFVGLLGDTSLQVTKLNRSDKSPQTILLKINKDFSSFKKVPGQD